MASNFMRCNETFWYSKGKKVDAGGRLWRADDPIVLKYGAFFSPIDDDGAVVESATAAPGERRMLARFRDKLTGPEPVAEVEPVTEVVAEPERSGRPWTTASKEEWMAYAESIGIDTAGMTKLQLVDAVAAREGQ